MQNVQLIRRFSLTAVTIGAFMLYLAFFLASFTTASSLEPEAHSRYSSNNALIETAGGGADFFSPSVVTIQAGETVTITNSGRGYHNVVFDDTFPNGDILDGFVADSPSTDEWVRTVTFEKPGTYYFYCDPHFDKITKEGMVGRITVESTPLNIYIYLPLIEKQ